MPIVTPNIYYFDNNNQDNIVYTDITVDYENKKINCQFQQANSKVKVFKKKWILKSFDDKRELEIDSDKLDFSLAQKFPNMTCESILFDGLLYKKEHVFKNFSIFENWPNISPGIQFYTVSSLSEFSISDYFKTKENKQYYFCESTSDNNDEKQFCSLIDKDTGKIDNKNSDSKQIKFLLGDEAYKIFNLIIGKKQDNKIIYQNGIQFLLYDNQSDLSSNKIPPKIEFNDSIFNRSLTCNSNLFLFYPNDKVITWTKNNKKINEITDKILPQKFIEYGQTYSCENQNGESEDFIISKNFLEIYGPSQIGFTNEESSKILNYEANLNLPEGKYSWSCQGSGNIKCERKNFPDKQSIQIDIIPNESFKKTLLHEKIKITLAVDNEVFEKEIVVYNYRENEEAVVNISSELSLIASGNGNSYYCSIPETIQKSSMLNIFWYLDNNEIESARNKQYLPNTIRKNYITCIIYGKLLNKNIIGAVSNALEDPNRKNPSWLKETYLLRLAENKKEFLFSAESEVNLHSLSCAISTNDNYTLTKNICLQDDKKNIYLKLSNSDILNIKNYFLSSPIIDYFNIPSLNLNIKIFEDSKLRNLQSKARFIIPNYKPEIYASGIVDLKQNEQKCFVITKDPQNLFLSALFGLEKNKVNKNMTFFDNTNVIQDVEYSNILNLLSKKNIFYYEYNFKLNQKEDYCNINVSNGTTIAQAKTSKYSLSAFKNKLIEISNKSNYQNSILKQNQLSHSEDIYKKKISVENDNIFVSFNNSNSNNNRNLFDLKFSQRNKEPYLNISYSLQKNAKNLMLLPSQLQNLNAIKSDNNESSISDLNNFFLSARVFKKGNEFICETFSYAKENEENLYNFNIYLNNNLILTKQSSKNILSIELKNLKQIDTISCQVKLNNKIETSSFTEIDLPENLSLCYALDTNGSILTFDCPLRVEMNQSMESMKKSLLKKLISQFKMLNYISHAHMILWTPSQKNKLSISIKIDPDLYMKN
ncbi:hypothetical protein [Silvanigrella aquatica]|uniref:Ig-like domain-containing protein n=1 Tax=Silvanigrella aquatica TaxID=1915309 RepID=A0A1L4CYN1_9BACT|nr:hypothetical protein [Silvanigrella aquatica]APJ03061.1 hypothetical protein AXG55_03705 [Silvanigrella aquatica]